MSCATSSSLRKSGATTVLRPGAEARTPFGTPFFNFVIDPETDTGTFVKQPLDARMWEEIRAWETLQRIGDDNGDDNDDNEDYDDRLWPDTYSIVSDSDVDYILDGFVVIDMSDATGSVFWNHRRRCRRKAVRRRGSPSLWSRFLLRLRPAGSAAH
ncbi:hypothetical protein GSI_00152 [Ganoderma sinense ZZ0214-1]|uniref:Uncharacterized protein n=1 Tax=Ganoderma sinense ZZ0214-1 TaxID=1077348 RepID=A0A2G8SRX4_9APHY|nr:hypothetical protein GSI_00152 [Ganoderma sinense ZZ0214-1]